MRGRNYKKILVIISVSIVSLIGIIILFISPIIKYLIERYDLKYIGREVSMDWAYVNPFTGHTYFNDIKIYEYKSDSLFFYADGLSIDFSINKLFSKTYEIKDLAIYRPWLVISQNNKSFNFDDIQEKFASDKSDVKKEPVHFNLLNIKINDGEIHYKEEIIPVNYSIKKFDFESSGKKWDADSISGKLSFISGVGSGEVKSSFSVNLKTNRYTIFVALHKFDLVLIEQYLQELTNYGSFTATADADLHATGSIEDSGDINAAGTLSINDFHFGKKSKEDYAAFDKLVVKINELNPKKNRYVFDSLFLSRPFFKYEKYDSLDNIETVFGKKGGNVKAVAVNPDRYNLVIEIARSVRLLANKILEGDYKIRRIAIYKGDIRFNDYSLTEKFSMGLYPLNILADSINKNHQRVKISLTSNIQPYGYLETLLHINPRDSSDFELAYHFQKIPAPMFNPYLISYTSFPLDRGTLEFKGKWKVRDGMIKSNNHLLMIDPREAKRIKKKDTKWVPMPLILALINEHANVIDYEIPITGNLKDPKFHFKDVIFDFLKNVFIKPPTTPYRMEVKNAETEIEKSLILKWSMRQSSLSSKQGKFVKDIADFLFKNPEASVIIYPIQYEEKEKEYILFFEAKKKYFLSVNRKNEKSFDAEDSIKVDRMSIRDSLFVQHLNRELNDSLSFTIQEKCRKYIPTKRVNETFKKLIKQRKENFISYFKEKSVENRIKFQINENKIPYNGLSLYRIDYNGEFPKKLIRAYTKLDELNNEPPREKFKNDRENSRYPL